MPVLIQVCIVLSTLALVVLAGLTLRTMGRVMAASDDVAALGKSLRCSLKQLDRATDEVAATSASVRHGIEPVLRVVGRLEEVGHRAADLASLTLDELAPPILTAASVVRGMRAGAGQFARLLMSRATRRHSTTSGGNNHD